jgi:hypothetical protein
MGGRFESLRRVQVAGQVQGQPQAARETGFYDSALSWGERFTHQCNHHRYVSFSCRSTHVDLGEQKVFPLLTWPHSLHYFPMVALERTTMLFGYSGPLAPKAFQGKVRWGLLKQPGPEKIQNTMIVADCRKCESDLEVSESSLFDKGT